MGVSLKGSAQRSAYPHAEADLASASFFFVLRGAMPLPAKSKIPAIPLRFAPGTLRGTRDPVSLRSRDERFSTPKGERGMFHSSRPLGIGL